VDRHVASAEGVDHRADLGDADSTDLDEGSDKTQAPEMVLAVFRLVGSRRLAAAQETLA
jgi:hypothetical protein